MHAAVSVRIYVCVHVLMHSPDWELAGCWPTLSCFHFSFTPHEQPRGSCSPSPFFISLLFPFSSQYLPGNNCDMNHFRQGGARLWEQKSRLQEAVEGKLYLDSHSSSSWWIRSSLLRRSVYLLSDFFCCCCGKQQSLRWAGNMRWCMQGKNRGTFPFVSSSNEDLWHNGRANKRALWSFMRALHELWRLDKCPEDVGVRVSEPTQSKSSNQARPFLFWVWLCEALSLSVITQYHLFLHYIFTLKGAICKNWPPYTITNEGQHFTRVTTSCC